MSVSLRVFFCTNPGSGRLVVDGQREGGLGLAALVTTVQEPSWYFWTFVGADSFQEKPCGLLT